MINVMFNTIAHKRIALFGFAFKANTGDTRESPAIYIARKLAEEHARVIITDPEALTNAEHDLKDICERVEFERDPYAAAQDAHAIAIIFDGRNILDHQKIYEIGFNVYPIGKPALTHF